MENDLRALMTDYLDDFVFDVVRNDDVFREKLSGVLSDAFLKKEHGDLSVLASSRFVSNKADIADYLHTMFMRYCEEVRATNSWGM